jgi:hypothetical protein
MSASTEVFFDGLQGASGVTIDHVLAGLALFGDQLA